MYPFDIQKNKPKGFPSLKKEPVFNPNIDLQLEKPENLAEETKYDFESREAKYLIERYT